MEIVIAVFLGCWLGAACLFAWRRLKKEFAPYMDQEKQR